MTAATGALTVVLVWYWMLAAGYAAAALLTAALVRRRRWLVLTGTALAGLLAVVPARCVLLPMLECAGGQPPAGGSDPVVSCERDDNPGCATIVGVAVPYDEALGAGAARLAGLGLVAATVLAAYAVARVRAGSVRAAGG